jgi:hypothetical protein
MGLPHLSVFAVKRHDGHEKEYEAEELMIRGKHTFRLDREIAAVSLVEVLNIDDR